MPKSEFNLDRQVEIARDLIPETPTSYAAFVETLREQGVTEPTRAIDMLKRRKLVKLTVGRNEAGEKFHNIQSAASYQEVGE